MSAPTYIVHEGKRRRVVREESFDDEPGYLIVDGAGRELWARATDCTTWIRTARPARRRMKDGRFVLEMCAGELAIRRARSPRRYHFTLREVFDMAVKRATFKGARTPKALRPRSRRHG